MALIEKIISGTKEGCILLKDNKREYPVSICGDATKDLIYYLKSAKNPKTRKRYESYIFRLKDPMSRYILKLAIDNSDRSKDLIEQIEAVIKI